MENQEGMEKNVEKKRKFAFISALVLACMIGVVGTSMVKDRKLLEDDAPVINVVETDTSTKKETDVAKTTESTASAEDKFDFSRVYDDNGFIKGFVASDVITLPSYDLLKVKKNGELSFQDEVDLEMQRIQAYYGESKKITDRKTAKGDWLEIAYTGTVDGESFEGGTSEANNIQAGGVGFIGTFQEQLIDKEVGKAFDIKVTFPADYWEKTLAGKDAVFSTTINYIHELVPFDKAFVESYLKEEYGWTEVDAAIAGLSEMLKDSQERNAVYDYMDLATAANKDLVVPEDMIKYIQAQTESYVKETAKTSGTTIEEAIKTITGFESLEALHESYKDTYKDEIVYMMLVQAVAEKEKINITKADIEKSLSEEGQTAEDIAFKLDYYGLPYMAQNTLVVTTMNNLKDRLESNN